ncbi:hypothetical protein TWF694_006117 [Orbilia ellipsospora]|uniref:UDP-N-acetylglucosamine 1-carboxyvinyltransferase n=1 Tax=Orbilia ellipsospora TaxID=2528407 RepID=A0AAV9WSP7_9PEZI
MKLEVFTRFTDALDAKIANLQPPPQSHDTPNSNNIKGTCNYRIHGGHKLSGSITLNASKNAAVALLCASLLNHGVTTFPNFPRIEEVYRILEVLTSIGVTTQWTDKNTLEIRRPKILSLSNLNETAACKTRSILMLIGALVHEYDEFEIPSPGGCELGERSISPHIHTFQEFGISIHPHENHKHYKISTISKRAPGEITLYESGNTVTNNAILAAACIKDEETYIQAASADYMVQDLCYFLRSLGVQIEGIGTPLLRIRGVGKIKRNVKYTPTEDPIEAMFFICAAVTTDSEITIRRVPFRWISLELLKLKKMGLRYTLSKPYKAHNGETDLANLTIQPHNGNLRALTDKIHANPWPGLNPDNLPYFLPIAACATGRTLIHDWMYESRAGYYTHLGSLGVDVETLDQHRVYVHGPSKLVSGGEMSCPPALRPASCLLVGMLGASGMSVLKGVYTVKRGYEDLEGRLGSLGARIEVFYD